MLRTHRILLVVIACAATALAVAPSAGAACAGEDLNYSASNEAAMVNAVTCLVNAERTARGLPALARDSRLDTAARNHSADMAENNYFDHDSQDGTKFSKRVTDAGYEWVSTGENIAAGQRTARSVMTAWMASDGHCRNILSGSYADIGVGLASGPGTYGLYWTQDFGRQSGSGTSSTAAAGCPFKSLTDSNPSTGSSPQGCTSTAGNTIRLSSLRRTKGGKLRIAGSTDTQGCCPKVQFTVKRGARTVKSTRSLCTDKFVVKLSLPKRRGDVRVTAKLLPDGSSAKRTLKL